MSEEDGYALYLWVPKSSSTSRDQAIFVDGATDASLSSLGGTAQDRCLDAHN